MTTLNILDQDLQSAIKHNTLTALGDWSDIPDYSIQPHQIRDLCTVINGRVITPPERKIDIFAKADYQLKPFTVNGSARKFEDLSYIVLDIETTLNKGKGIEDIVKNGSIKMVGLKSDTGARRVFYGNDNEYKILCDTFRLINQKKPDIIFTHYGTGFDLPYLYYKGVQYGLSGHNVSEDVRCPFWVSDRQKRFGAAAIAGSKQNEWFTPVYGNVWTNGVKKKIQLIDTMQLAIGFDSIMRKLSNYKLKSVPVELGLRKAGDRVELTPEELEACYEAENWQLLTDYLVDDLDDTELIAKKLLPGIYYQQLMYPEFNLQELVTAGNATKNLKLLDNLYGAKKKTEQNDKLQFQGAFTFSLAGLHLDVIGIDVSGQYPSSMLQYGITSSNDPDKHLLSLLQWAVDFRNSIKYKDEGDMTEEEEQFATIVKPVVNSCLKDSTLVLTDKGTYPVIDLVGRKVNVLNKNRNWVEVEFKSYGVQKLYKVRMKRKREIEEIYCTADHEWEIQTYDKYYKQHQKECSKVVTTSKLNQGRYGDLVPNVVSIKPDDTNQDYFNGVIHGIIYGDGSKKLCSGKAINYNPEKGQAFVIDLIANKKEIEHYFDKANNVIVTARRDTEDNNYKDPNVRAIRVYSHIELKDLPPLESSNSYLLGFFRGLLTTDGTISDEKSANPCFTMQEFVCDYLNKIVPRIGFKGFKPFLVNTEGNIHTWKDGRTSRVNFDYYRVAFQIEQFTSEDFLRSVHRNNFEARIDGIKKTSAPWRVLSVEETNLTEEVYCCVEPETHTFTLGNGILTRNCYGTYASMIPYGDSIAAALVTCYSRARLLWMREQVENLGGTVVLSDTDSVFIKTTRTDWQTIGLSDKYKSKLPPDASPEMLTAAAIAQRVIQTSPDMMKVDFDGAMKCLFVPGKLTKSDYNKSYKVDCVNGRKFVLKHLNQECLDDLLTNQPDAKITFDLLSDTAKNHGFVFPDATESIKKNYLKLIWKVSDYHQFILKHLNQECLDDLAINYPNTKVELELLIVIAKKHGIDLSNLKESVKQKYYKLTWEANTYQLKAKGKYVKRDKSVFQKKYQQEYLIRLNNQGLSEAEAYHKEVELKIMSGVYPIEDLRINRKVRINEKTICIALNVRKGDPVIYYYGKGGEMVQSGDYDVDYYIKELTDMHDQIIVHIKELN